jgi:uncharacterized Zn finger protein (UPF0148 family)
MPDKAPDICPKCGDTLVEGKMFCPNCGLAIVSVPERVAVDAYIEARVRQSVDARMADKDSLVRAIADDAEDVVWTRLKRYTWVAGIAIFLLGLYGFSSIQQAKSTIVSEAHARLDPVIDDTEKRVKKAQVDIGDTGQKIAAVKKQLDDTSKLAQEQSNRITGQAGEINTKLQQVQTASNRANALSTGYEKQAADFESELQQMRAHAEQENHRLDDTQKTFNARIEQVTKQIDNVSLQQAYPTLGKKMYVTYNGQPWKGTAGKKPSDKWVNINLDPMAVGSNRVTTEELQTLADRLEKAGYTPYFGFFGTGGPVGTGFGCLANGNEGIMYFDPKREKEASDVQRMAADTLHLPGFTAHYVDPKKAEEPLMRFVMENAGMDFQVCIARPRP